jgi:tRNA A58 N-methylase Trm61
MTEKIKSDGGSSRYYEIMIPKDNVIERDGYYIIQVEDVIEFGMGNDFDKGNLFKVLYRLGKKAGNTISYELNKMKYSLNRLTKRFEDNGND